VYDYFEVVVDEHRLLEQVEVPFLLDSNILAVSLTTARREWRAIAKIQSIMNQKIHAE